MGGVQLRNKIAVELPNDCLPNINDLRQIFDDSQAGLRSSHNGSDAAMHHAASVKRSSHNVCLAFAIVLGTGLHASGVTTVVGLS